MMPTELDRLERRTRRRRAFSLLELVVNLIILAMVAAIAVPRFSRAARSAQANGLAMNLTRVRNAIEHYYAEHGHYPGVKPGTGTVDGAAFVQQLTQYTDTAGNAGNALKFPFIYGPYIRPPFPTNPLNGLDTVTAVKTFGTKVPVDSSGWKMVVATGHFSANSSAARLADIGVIDAGAATQTTVLQTGGG